ncbi:DsbA family protein [Deinococcus sonorensis]|uniref:Thioredoxin domain-containing protein n=2 Tax=Deinococcus sonorensis TaxID=309891 RepID=A0AAU7U946_9DEIO
MPTASLRRSLTVLALAALSSVSVFAQVGAPVARLLQQPAFHGFQQAGAQLSGPGGVRVQLTPRGRFLEQATLTVPSADPALVARYLNVLLDGDYTAALTDFLGRPSVKAALPAGFTTQADAYDLRLQSSGAGLQVRVSLHQQSGFAPVPVARTLGSAAAPIVVRLYSDFQCPFCQKAELEALPAVLRQLGPDVRFEFHHLPLERLHPNARSAAEASVCAEQQGKFWPFKDALFRRNDWQRADSPVAAYRAVAAQVGLNLDQYQRCVASRAGRAEVDAGLAEADRLEVSGTPTVFVNGYTVPDPYDAASYQQLIEFVRAR